MVDDAAVGTLTWSNYNNAKSSDDAYATAVGKNNAVSHYLKASNFGFTIPAGATIDGIKVQIERHMGGGASAIDDRVSIVKADGSVGTTNYKSATAWGFTTNIYFDYGGITDLWGEEWDAASINDADFGVVLSTKHTHPVSISTAYVDHIRITVYYTEAAGGISIPVVQYYYNRLRRN
jgi:hypothetical protein